jgi:hypothetical protein
MVTAGTVCSWLTARERPTVGKSATPSTEGESAPATPTSHRLIWLVPSNQLSNFHHDQPRTLVDNGGQPDLGQVCDGPGSLARHVGSGRRGHE